MSGKRGRAGELGSLGKAGWRWNAHGTAGGKGGGNCTAGAKLPIRRAKGSLGHSVFWGDWTGRSRARCLQESLMKGFQYEGWGAEDRGLVGDSVEATIDQVTLEGVY